MTTRTHFLWLLLFSLLLVACGPQLPPVSDAGADHIRINQLGYYPATENGVVMTARPAKDRIMVVDADAQQVISEHTISDSLLYALSGETVWTANFTAPGPGKYRLYVPGLGYSYPFTVADNVLEKAFYGSAKGLYYQRASMALEATHAGQWARPAGHPDTAVLYHPFSGYTQGQRSSPGGWYDAGDYNKYVVNGAFSLGQMLSLYEDVGDPAPDGSLNIPESGNGKSDYLDELKIELDWLLTMQDTDGGLFHKLTTQDFEGMTVMPHQATQQRYIVGKGTAATLDFAGALALAYRVYQDYDAAYAANLLSQAKLAWSWAVQHPAVAYTNPPDVQTGQYGDDDFTDEFYWAAAELYLSTEDGQYREYLVQNPLRIDYQAAESWTGFMGLMGAFSLLRYPDKVPATLFNTTRAGIMALADSLALVSLGNDYGQPLKKFAWGSSSDVLNAIMVIIAANQLDPKPEYTRTIRSAVDYVLGKNATGYSFLTGFGSKTPRNIHHRQSAADDIDPPVPGLLSGGPNSKQQDKPFATYPAGVAPMQSWVDQEGSYASNEICLNWNAPLIYVLGWLEKH